MKSTHGSVPFKLLYQSRELQYGHLMGHALSVGGWGEVGVGLEGVPGSCYL